MNIPKYNDVNNKNYTEINSKIIDRWIDEGTEWGIPISHEQFIKAKNGDWDVGLAFDIVPKEWFSPYINLDNSRLDGIKILGLASGGGQQMPMFAANGADCTILDYSDRQLASEQFVSEREGYQINIIKADMTKELPFDNNSFDIIFHPVSNCYIEDVYHVWNECFRILKPSGILLAGMVKDVSYLFDEPDDENEELIVKYKLPFNTLDNPALFNKMITDDYAIQFSHSLADQLGGQLKAGFSLTDIIESRDPESLLSKYIPEYLSTRSIKPKKENR